MPDGAKGRDRTPSSPKRRGTSVGVPLCSHRRVSSGVDRARRPRPAHSFEATAPRSTPVRPPSPSFGSGRAPDCPAGSISVMALRTRRPRAAFDISHRLSFTPPGSRLLLLKPQITIKTKPPAKGRSRTRCRRDAADQASDPSPPARSSAGPTDPQRGSPTHARSARSHSARCRHSGAVAAAATFDRHPEGAPRMANNGRPFGRDGH